MLFRVAVIVLFSTAVAGTTYVSYHGIGRESRDLDRSVRIGSPGGGYASGGRVK